MNAFTKPIRTLLCALASGFIATSALAQASAPATPLAPKYAVMSLIGGNVNVVFNATPQTGSRIDRNDRFRVEVQQRPFDVVALRKIEQSLKAQDPGREVAMFNGLKSLIEATPSSLFAGDKVTLSPGLLATMRESGASRLLLVTRHRQEAHLRADNVELGNGRLEGVGFYIDYSTPMRNTRTNELVDGFLAAYVNLRLSLVDLEQGAVLAQFAVSNSEMALASYASTKTDPWTVLNPVQKIEALEFLVDREIKRALDQVLAKAG